MVRGRDVVMGRRGRGRDVVMGRRGRGRDGSDVGKG